MAIGRTRLVWLLDLTVAGVTHRLASADLISDAEVAALGFPYRGRIANRDLAVATRADELLSGVVVPDDVQIRIDNTEFTTQVDPKALKLWLRADLETGYADGDPVGTARDFSGSGHDYTAAGAARPTYRSASADALNGLPVFDFDNVDDGMTGPATLGSAGTVIVAYADDDGGPTARRAVQGASNNWLLGPYNRGAGPKHNAFAGGWLDPEGPAAVVGQPVVSAMRYRQGSFAEQWVDGTKFGTLSGAGVLGPGSLRLGAAGAFSEPLGGRFCELLAYDRFLPYGELFRYMAMLARRWGAGGPAAQGLDNGIDMRLAPATLSIFDRDALTKTTVLPGLVRNHQHRGLSIVLTIGSFAREILRRQVPAVTVNPSGDFATARDPNAAIPVVYGENVPVRPPHVADRTATTNPAGNDYLVSHVATTRIREAFIDKDRDSPNLEALLRYQPGPGSPVFVSSTRFSVTGDQSDFYHVAGGGTPFGGITVRFDTNNDGVFIYTSVADYDSAASPDEVVLADAVLPSNFTNLEIGGEMLVLPGRYAGYSAVRLRTAPDAALIVTATRTGVSNPATFIKEVLNDAAYGLNQAVDAASFVTAFGDFLAAGLDDAIDGALGQNKDQRAAEGYLTEALQLRGGRLLLTSASPVTWGCTVDTQPAAAPVARFELGPGSRGNISEIISFDCRPADSAVRNVVVAFKPVGRARDRRRQFEVGSSEFQRTATVAVTGKGRDRVFNTVLLRKDDPAGRFAFYAAKRLLAADRPLVIRVPTPEALAAVVGAVVRCLIPHLGVHGDFQVLVRTLQLTETTLTLVPQLREIYIYDASAVTFNDAPTVSDDEDAEEPGPNLLRNPDFSEPFVENSSPPATPVLVPHGWFVASSTPEIDFRGVNKDTTIIDRLESGRYVEIDMPSPPVSGNPGIVSDSFVVEPGRLTFYAVRCDQDSGFALFVTYYVDLVVHSVVRIPLVRDPNFNGLGWARFWGSHVVPRVPTLPNRADLFIGTMQTGTFRFEAPFVQRAGKGQVRPGDWSRDRPQGAWHARYGALTVVPGSGFQDVAGLCLPGEQCLGVYTRITTNVTLGGGGTSVSVGTPNFKTAWAKGRSGAELNAPSVWGSEGDKGWQSVQPVTYPTGFVLRVSVDQAGGTLQTGAFAFKALVRRENEQDL